MKSNHITPKTSEDTLNTLLANLSKAEKRNFKLYVKRLESNQSVLYLRLYDYLEKHPGTADVQLREVLNISPAQLSNIRRHLYKQLLVSLRMLYRKKHISIEIREKLDHAQILYDKGMYLSALRLLEKTREQAQDHHRELLLLEILEMIKFIEERHITRSRKTDHKMENLIERSELQQETISRAVQLSSLKLKIHGLYIQMGHIRHERDKFFVQQYFQDHLPKPSTEPSFFERVYLAQAYMWYYYILLDWRSCLQYADAWIREFDNRPDMLVHDYALYMRGLSYKLTSLYNLQDRTGFSDALEEFIHFTEEHQADFSLLEQVTNFIYLYTHRINRHFLNKSYKVGCAMIPEVLSMLKKYERHMDIHRVMVFNYKIAWIYYGAIDLDKAIEHLNIIINLRAGHLREDIQCYARLTHLMAHFDLGHTELLPYLIESVTRFFVKMQDLNTLQRRLLDFFKAHSGSVGHELREALMDLRTEILAIREDRYQQRAFFHMEIEDWLERRIDALSSDRL